MMSSWTSAKVDEYLELIKETWDIFIPTFSIKVLRFKLGTITHQE
jgi:hypothetical protein